MDSSAVTERSRRERASPGGLGRAKEVMLGGFGAVPRSTGSPHGRGVHQVALGNAEVQGRGPGSVLLRAQTGRPGLGACGCLEKGSSRQGCVQAPSPRLEERASELRSEGWAS